MLKGTLNVALVALLSTAVLAEQRAVIVGVSEYPFLDPAYSLVGPLNDTQLLKNYFSDAGFSKDRLIVLSEAEATDFLPNKNNILRVLNQQVKELKSGDLLYLHFSGHGSQQPAPPGDEEIDGLTEIFLPRDTKKWNGSTGNVTNAITDNEIAALLEQFESKGIFVWLVFDSCHSGTMSRSTARMRKLKPDVLGVPKTRSAGSISGTTKRKANLLDTKEVGNFVAFFAAQTNEETPEMKLPKRSQEAETYGLFTFQLLEALRANPNASYRQIAEQVMQNYLAYPWYGSSPMFVGGGLDLPVLQGEVRTQKEQWPIDERGAIPVGYLHGLTASSELLLLNKPADADEDGLGTLTVSGLGADVSLLTAHPSIEMPKGAYARLMTRGVDLGLTVSSLDQNEQVARVLNNLKGSIGIDLVADTANADVRLMTIKDQLVVLTASEELPCDDCSLKGYISIALKNGFENELETVLTKLGKALNLSRLGSVLTLDGLDTKLNVVRNGSGKRESFGINQVPELYAGDSLSLTIANFLEVPLDITVLFVSADFSIDVVFPRRGAFNRFMEEEERTIQLGKINAETVGMERLVIIGSTTQRSAALVNYGFLAESSVERTRSTSSALGHLLTEAGFGGLTTRSSNTSHLTADSDIHTIAWITRAQ